ncbi:hypothetical protein [Brachybacterium sacelli]
MSTRERTGPRTVLVIGATAGPADRWWTGSSQQAWRSARWSGIL